MRIPLLLLTLPTGLLAACSSPSSETTTTQVPTATAPLEPLDTSRAPGVTPQSDTLKVVRSRHVFSQPGQPDRFMLALRGRDLTTGEATLTITAANGTVIFREMLQAADLEASMVYTMPNATASKAEREAFIRRRMDEFFANKQFQQPAVAAREARPAAINSAAWAELQRPDAVSFRYLVGKEDQRRVAWSEAGKQVVKLPGFGG